ncbi:MAG: hypothetical protein RLZ37_1931 [Actinomycetota bacterium]
MTGTIRRITTVQFAGRLGNLFFEYAAALTLHRARGGELRFLDWRTPSRADFLAYLDPDGSAGLHREFRGVRYFERSRLAGKVKWQVMRVIRGIVRRVRGAAGVQSRFTPEDPFAPAPENLAALDHRRLLVHGYFQHPSWFEPTLGEVTGRIWSTVGPHVCHLANHNATVMAVRLGDYRRLGWELTAPYYERAIEALGDLDGPIWITSDDPAGALRLLAPILDKHGQCASPLPEVDMTASMRDFALLCVARNVIMSNSTFCWWGTVTGQLQGGQEPKRIVCPTPWLPTTDKSVALIRADWIAVEASFPPKPAPQ